MMRFVHRFSIACIALAGLFTANVETASAQTYDFTFSCGAGCGITNGVVTVLTGTVQSVSGTLIGVPAVLHGAASFSYALPNQFVWLYTDPTNYMMDVYSGPFEINIGAGMDLSNCYNEQSGCSWSTEKLYVGGSSLAGSSTMTLASTPAPVPGSGPLSYLAGALIVLGIKRKRLIGQARSLAGRLSSLRRAKS